MILAAEVSPLRIAIQPLLLTVLETLQVQQALMDQMPIYFQVPL